MDPRPLLTLTTDFGYKDPFAGIMKGVMLSINPAVQIIDITHNISPQNVLETAFTLDMGYNSFPHKTIHVVVVDPGVGSERRPILVVTDYHYYIGPDNGIFSRIYSMSETLAVYHLTAEHYFSPQRSSTFHGRDVFAPAAAWFSKGIDAAKFGDRISDYVTLQLPVPTMTTENTAEGEIIYIDRFGNLMTNIGVKNIKDLISSTGKKNLIVEMRGMEVPLKKFYSAGEGKKLSCLINSFGYLELFVNKGNASENFGMTAGEKVSMTCG
jgi:S-adenosylmethionine hydrolase